MWATWVWSLGQTNPLEKNWQPTPVFLLGESHGQRSLEDYSPWAYKVGHGWAINTHTFSSLFQFLFLSSHEHNTTGFCPQTASKTFLVNTNVVKSIVHSSGFNIFDPPEKSLFFNPFCSFTLMQHPLWWFSYLTTSSYWILLLFLLCKQIYAPRNCPGCFYSFYLILGPRAS